MSNKSDDTPEGYGAYSSLSREERATLTVLVVEPEEEDAQAMREALQDMGFKSISIAANHGMGLKLLNERSFSHVIFSAKQIKTPVETFVNQFLSDNPDCVMIPSSYEPSIDNLFDLLRIGCKGFLVLPCSELDLEGAICSATRGDTFSPEILNAIDRNQAFSALMSAGLDKLAQATKDAEKFNIAKKELPMIMANFQACVKLGKVFAEGTQDELHLKIVSHFEKLSSGPATRIGRLRKRLGTKRRADSNANQNS